MAPQPNVSTDRPFGINPRYLDRVTTEGPVGAITGYYESGHTNLTGRIWATHAWFRNNVPEAAVTNLRAGFASWFAWAAIFHGVPLIAVAVPAQIERARPDIAEGLMELWMRAAQRVTCPTPQERDEKVVSLSHRIVTLDDMTQYKMNGAVRRPGDYHAR